MCGIRRGGQRRGGVTRQRPESSEAAMSENSSWESLKAVSKRKLPLPPAKPVKGTASSKADAGKSRPLTKTGGGGKATSSRSAGNKSHHRKPPLLRATDGEILTAIESLYKDELKPYGRIIRKRLVEFAAARPGGGVVDVDAKHLYDVCVKIPSLEIECWEGGEWCALFVGRSAKFVDLYSPRDVYPQELWDAAASYFEKEGSEIDLPGGRYSCAQALYALKLGFLSGYSLGQVCHIVELSLTVKKTLGYSSGSIVAYARSQSMLKESCAECQCPCAAVASKESQASGLRLATWDVARTCLREILKGAKDHVSKPDAVPISNVKRLFRSDFQTELSETALGHARLSDLLQDSRLADVCSLQLQVQGYFVVPPMHPLVDESVVISLADELPRTPEACGSEFCVTEQEITCSFLHREETGTSCTAVDRTVLSPDVPLQPSHREDTGVVSSHHSLSMCVAPAYESQQSLEIFNGQLLAPLAYRPAPPPIETSFMEDVCGQYAAIYPPTTALMEGHREWLELLPAVSPSTAFFEYGYEPCVAAQPTLFPTAASQQYVAQMSGYI